MRDVASILSKGLLVMTLAVLIVSCKPTAQHFSGPDAEILNAQVDRARKVEVTAVLSVKKILPDDTEGLPHQRFLVELSNNSTVLVAHDTAIAPKVPLSPGDQVRIHGEYIWNEKGGVIHWTHHSDSPRHEGGWIEYKGQKFQ